ncbi:hypothetical protein OH77DRAFT_1357859, partial [Trametes cingulata]
SLPLPGSAAAPSFNPAVPRSIGRFFEDLEYIFSRAKVCDDATRKRAACRYVPLEVEELWSTLPEASPQSPASFVEFRDAVFALYPEYSCGRMFSLSDLEQLVDARRSRPFTSLLEYGEFYRTFFGMSSHLRSTGHLGEAEQSRLFLRALEPELRSKIDFRRQILFPSLHLDAFITLSKLHDMVVFVLPSLLPHSSSSWSPSQRVEASGRASSSFEELSPAGRMPSSAVAAVSESSSNAPRASSMVDPSLRRSHQPSASPRRTCHYCGALSCFIRRCPVVEVDIAAGRCKRNQDGQVVLPTGRFVPRALPGRTMRKRILEWHRR